MGDVSSPCLCLLTEIRHLLTEVTAEQCFSEDISGAYLVGSGTYVPLRYLAKEIKWLAHGHTGNLWQSQELKPTFKLLNHKIIILPCLKLLILMLVRRPEAQDGCLLIGARHTNMHIDLCIHIFKTGWKNYLVSHLDLTLVALLLVYIELRMRWKVTSFLPYREHLLMGLYM